MSAIFLPSVIVKTAGVCTVPNESVKMDGRLLQNCWFFINLLMKLALLFKQIFFQQHYILSTEIITRKQIRDYLFEKKFLFLQLWNYQLCIYYVLSKRM